MISFFLFLILFLLDLLEVLGVGKLWLPLVLLILAYFRGEKILVPAFLVGLFLDFLLMDHLGTWILINLAVVLLAIFLRGGLGEGRKNDRLKLPE